jgi:hypothetical protein
VRFEAADGVDDIVVLFGLRHHLPGRKLYL